MSTPTVSDSIALLYCQHHGWLQGWLRRKLNCTQQAADLAQDTFVRLLAKPEPQALREPRAYLTTVARGLVINHWRRQALEQAWLEELAARPEATSPSPEERRLILETLEEIARLLDGLPPRVREIFLRSQLEAQTYPVIAEQLGVSVNVVQKAMLRATAHCYRALYA
ncbi:sigma-70 family RNA polymerase sigma factor [Azovibrio restrictus]|uniref:sigma-70 family RNA polymerase sigma factor n=1 Tax=Azovibrio restrictus TaxID=146938 RepID=UPI0026EA20C8|nr:sigma-70 family RNA polymerase sigma factor [Azovibrio restrictus]MDD3484085.1 sigma-70 family RNA polymerase sigma factor [Azovibrio restrictus]